MNSLFTYEIPINNNTITIRIITNEEFAGYTNTQTLKDHIENSWYIAYNLTEQQNKHDTTQRTAYCLFKNKLIKTLQFCNVELHFVECGFILEDDMKQQIYVTVQAAGVHYWPTAGQDSKNHAYLGHLHRHIFTIKVVMSVTHNNRDIEFLDLKDKIYVALACYYPRNETKTEFDFGTESCEQIAIKLRNEFDADLVEVSEDGENGAIISK